MRLVERDYCILSEIDRWKWCLSRHVKGLAGFSGQRATDRRLRVLIDNGYIERRHVLYGVPSLYSLTFKSKKLLGIPTRKEKIKIDQIFHDISVIDVVLFFVFKHNISTKSILSEKELHSKDGFANRKHRPDFVFTKDSHTYCVEIELTLKSRARFEQNIKDNFLSYDYQNWIVPSSKFKIRKVLKENAVTYDTMSIIDLEEVTQYVKSI